MEDCKNTRTSTDVIREYKPYKRKELWSRIAKNECEYCHNPMVPMEKISPMHHLGYFNMFRSMLFVMSAAKVVINFETTKLFKGKVKIGA